MSLAALFGQLPSPRAGLSLTDPRGWGSIWSSWGYPKAAAGIRVSPQKATALTAYFAGIMIISSDTAKVPAKTFQRVAGGGREERPEHPAYNLLMVEANETTTAVNAREDLMARYLGWGNGYAKIRRNSLGEPMMLDVLHPPRVRPARDERGYYFEHWPIGQGDPEIIRAEDMIHLRGPNGWSAARQGAEALGIGLVEQEYAATYLRNASHPSGVIEMAGEVDDTKLKKFKEEWQERFARGRKRHSVSVLPWGAKYTNIYVKPSDAQLLDSRKFSVTEIARLLRLSPQKLMDTTRAQGWSTLESLNTDHVTDGLMPHMVRLEFECNRKLFTERERAAGYFIQHVVQALMRGDAKTRAAFYAILSRLGVVTINEMRAWENMNPIGPEGDVHFVSANMVPLKIAVEGGHLRAIAQPASSSSPGRGGPGGEQGMNDQAVRRVFVDAATRMVKMQLNAACRLEGKHRENPDAFASAVQAQALKMAARVPHFFESAAGLLGVDKPDLDVCCEVLMSEGARDIVHAFAGAGVEKSGDALEAELVDRAVGMIIAKCAGSAARKVAA